VELAKWQVALRRSMKKPSPLVIIEFLPLRANPARATTSK